MKTAGWSTHRVAGQSNVSVAIVPQKRFPDTQRGYKFSRISALSCALFNTRNIGNCAYSAAKPGQCGMSEAGKVCILVMNRFVLGTDDNRVRVWRRLQELLKTSTSFSDSSMAGPLPDLSPVSTWDQLKRQMPSCHSVHDLELAVQDLWSPSASGQHKFTCRNCGGGDRGRVAIYRPFGNFAELNRTVTCMVLKANDRRTLSMP
ncbi:hypothetical protein TNCV_137721 [Trichonephila clavipes]|nr:hypothetical protein TNCV_137721 [Trichonephila clavipes]